MGLFGINKPKTEEEIRESEINKLLDDICGKRLSTSPIFSYIVFNYVKIGDNGFCGVPFDTIKNILKKELVNQKLTDEKIENRIVELIQLDYEQLRNISHNKIDTSIFHSQDDIIKYFNEYTPEKFLENQEKIKQSQLKFKETQNNQKNTNISNNDIFKEIKRVVDGFYFKYKMAYLNFNEDNKDNIKKILELECKNNQLLVENIEDRAHELIMNNDNNFDEMKDNLLKMNDGSFISNDSADYDFSCSIDEIRTNWAGEKKEDRRNCHVRVLDDKLIIQKTGVLIKSDLGNRTIYFSDISSIDFDKAGLLHVTSSINIILRGGEPVTLIYANESHFNLLNEKWRNYKEMQHKSETKITSQPIKQESPQHIENPVSNADELLKYAELYEKGLLTEEEFNSFKQTLLSNSVKSSTKFCGNCGAEISPDSKFCSECGTQIK